MWHGNKGLSTLVCDDVKVEAAEMRCQQQARKGPWRDRTRRTMRGQWSEMWRMAAGSMGASRQTSEEDRVAGDG